MRSPRYLPAPLRIDVPWRPGMQQKRQPDNSLESLFSARWFAWSPERGLGALSGASGQHAFVIRGDSTLLEPHTRRRFSGKLKRCSIFPKQFRRSRNGRQSKLANPFQDMPALQALLMHRIHSVRRSKTGSERDFSSLYPLEMDNLTSNFDVPYTYNST